MRIPTVAMAAGSLALLAAAASPLLPVQAQTSGHHNSCERKFDAAQRQDMESFRDYDREAFVDVHHPDAVSVFAAGVVAVGRDEIMEALDGYFRDKVAEMELDRGDPRGARLQDRGHRLSDAHRAARPHSARTQHGHLLLRARSVARGLRSGDRHRASGDRRLSISGGPEPPGQGVLQT